MNDSKYDQKKNNYRKQGQDYSLDLAKIFTLIISRWYYFILSLIVTFLCGVFYINHTLPKYRVSALILLNQNQGNAPLNDQILQGMGLNPGRQNIQNQIMLLSSRTLTERALNELPFEIDFYFRTLKNKLPIYPEKPIQISLISGTSIPRNKDFIFTYLGNDQFSLHAKFSKQVEIKVMSSFGDTIQIPDGSISLYPSDTEWLNKNQNRKFHFVIPDKMTLVKNYNRRLKVESVAREGTVLKISLEGTNIVKDVDFINMLTDIFVSLSLDKKNLEAENRLSFINDQLVGITDSLSLTENRLQQFRSRNRIMDLSTQGEAIIAQSVELENIRAQITIEKNYYDYLAEYLEKNVTDEIPVAPATMGITDPGLTRLVAELATLQGELSSKSLGQMNPLQNQLIQRIKNSKEALLQTLNGLRRANSLALEENLSQINRLNNQAATLPGTERQLLGIERKFKLNDELYTFLLEKRSEQLMQKAANVADNEVIDYANKDDNKLISPNPALVFVSAWFFGLLIPFLIILLFDYLNKTVKSEDIDQLTDFPIIGKIPRNSSKSNIVVFENPDSVISEAFRIIRSKIPFFTKEAKSPVILLTSSSPEDGKTFISINLASVLSLTGKKTILIGFDLRKPKIFSDFELDNEKGVSTWLIGKDRLEDVIRTTHYKNLFVIPAGPIPPNPSELTALPKTKELISLLREKFDFIVIDSSPIGLVSDTFYLASLADLCLLVIRYAKTLKNELGKTIGELKISDNKSISLIINDISGDHGHYGYSTKYGYTKEKENNVKKIGGIINTKKRIQKNKVNGLDKKEPQWHSKI